MDTATEIDYPSRLFHTGRMLGFWFSGPSEVAPIVAVMEVISNQCS